MAVYAVVRRNAGISLYYRNVRSQVNTGSYIYDCKKKKKTVIKLEHRLHAL